VVRYLVREPHGSLVPLVGKRFDEPSRARLLHEHLRLLADGPFGSGELRVPKPVGLLPDQRMVLYHHVDGTPLDRIDDPVEADDGVRSAARWLARLHTSLVRLPRTFSIAQEADSARQWASIIATRHPQLEAQAGALAHAWVASARRAPLRHDVPIHKDFHPGHVLLGRAVCVLDLDEARMGDPAFDIAHFCSCLDMGRDGGSRGSLADAFRAEYVGATGWADQGSYVAFCAYTWLKLAKQCAVGSGPWRESGPGGRTAVEHALTEGARCLSE
jgi:aminoglycoside phosphotransferase (APT) family kinase protein